VLQGVPHHSIQLDARVTVLCGSIAHRYTGRRLRPGVNVEREAVRMALAVGPYAVGEGLDAVGYGSDIIL
jgi:hypothetical protein